MGFDISEEAFNAGVGFKEIEADHTGRATVYGVAEAIESMGWEDMETFGQAFQAFCDDLGDEIEDFTAAALLTAFAKTVIGLRFELEDKRAQEAMRAAPKPAFDLEAAHAASRERH